MRINNLQGCSIGYYLTECLHKRSQTSLIITPDTLKAQILEDAIKFFSSQHINTTYFPDYETLPYDLLSPHQSVISERIKILDALSKNKEQVLIASINTLLHVLPPTSFFAQYHLSLQVGDYLSIDEFRKKVETSGYRLTNQVLSHGECAIRGSIIDIFPMGSQEPYRIDIFDNEIETIRTFNPDTQLTIDRINEIQLLPAHEFPTDDVAVKRFRAAFREMFPGNPRQASIYQDMSNHIIPAGIESYLPLFYEKTCSIFDYLPSSAQVFIIDDCAQSSERFLSEVTHRYNQRSSDITKPILAPNQLYLTTEYFFQKLKQYETNYLTQNKKTKSNADTEIQSDLKINRLHKSPLIKLKNYLNENSHKINIIVCESKGRREALSELLNESDIPFKISQSFEEAITHQNGTMITTGHLNEGAELTDKNINIIVENQLFDIQYVRQKRKRTIDPDLIIKDLTELKINDAVVHIEYGVGRYLGLTVIEYDNNANEFLILEYKNKSKLYIPVTSLHLISRYCGGNNEHIPLHTLGSNTWEKEKKKAITEITDVACELLDIYSARKAQQGTAFSKPNTDYKKFSEHFPFDETPDQKAAIEAIINDLTESKPMDRLICGDVGFGKTEVAMRAAFLALQSGFQVCMLVPTTLLAEQHYQNMLDRFSEFPVNIELISRFKTKAQSEKIIEKVSSGTIDILVGTHKIFSKHLIFKRLGLLIIDEEHRFGVKQKEHIKAIKANIDTLSMTATPIPRTLNMAMNGLQDISIIATPPAKRLAIKTFQHQKNDELIKDAISREILRGGQVFYLHNDVATIENTTIKLQTLIPEAKISFAHGQMRERQLERIMADFYHQRFNVLVCTTIIETGIDIPQANTIIIERADKFGLAQLHQLRGRVGRSHHQAYAYMLTPPKKAMTSDANRRLEALLSMEDLGSGFILASHDLEIRGAGALLGQEQSGHMHQIGFSLYMELLNKAVSEIKQGNKKTLTLSMSSGPEIKLPFSTIIPEHYIADTHLRLTIYKRIASSESKQELDELKVELIDRFGLIPESVQHLFTVTDFKLQASELGIHTIKGQENNLALTFKEKNTINPEIIIHLIQMHATRYKLNGANKLIVTVEKSNQFAELKILFESLSNNDCSLCKENRKAC